MVGDLDAALTNAQVWLEVEANGSKLSPRERLLAVPYAKAVRGLRLYPDGSLALNADRGSNVIDGRLYATIGGGWANRIHWDSFYATIDGGLDNQIGTSCWFSTIGGGYQNVISNNSHHAVIPGGQENRIGTNAHYAFAADYGAVANHQGAFVWADSTGANVLSTNANSVTFRAAGGYRFFSNGGMTLGAQLAPNATAWAAISDREAKENIAPIAPERLLEGVKQMPLSAWNYKADPGERRYIGPMAQDFHALFGLGDDKTINTLDADGVLFAAVQALAQKSDALARENEALRHDNNELRRRLEALEEKVSNF